MTLLLIAELAAIVYVTLEKEDVSIRSMAVFPRYVLSLHVRMSPLVIVYHRYVSGLYVDNVRISSLRSGIIRRQCSYFAVTVRDYTSTTFVFRRWVPGLYVGIFSEFILIMCVDYTKVYCRHCSYFVVMFRAFTQVLSSVFVFYRYVCRGYTYVILRPCSYVIVLTWRYT